KPFNVKCGSTWSIVFDASAIKEASPPVAMTFGFWFVSCFIRRTIPSTDRHSREKYQIASLLPLRSRSRVEAPEFRFWATSPLYGIMHPWKSIFQGRLILLHILHPH